MASVSWINSKETFSSETNIAGICLRTQTLCDLEVVEAGRRIRTVDWQLYMTVYKDLNNEWTLTGYDIK